MNKVTWVLAFLIAIGLAYFTATGGNQIVPKVAARGANDQGVDTKGSETSNSVAVIENPANLEKATDVLPSVASESVKRLESADVNMAYEYFRLGDSYTAFQIVENSRWNSFENMGLFTDVMTLCTYSQESDEKTAIRVAALRKQGGPMAESGVWKLILGKQICKGFKPAPVDTQAAFAKFVELSVARRKREETEPLPRPEQRRNWSDKEVIEANDPAKLGDLIRSGSFQGAIGGEYFGVLPDSDWSNSPSSQRLSRAQAVAIMRLRCDMTQSCGPNQVDSLLLCSWFAQCRLGVTVNSVWQNVAAPYELQAADAIYREYVLRRTQRGG